MTRRWPLGWAVIGSLVTLLGCGSSAEPEHPSATTRPERPISRQRSVTLPGETTPRRIVQTPDGPVILPRRPVAYRAAGQPACRPVPASPPGTPPRTRLKLPAPRLAARRIAERTVLVGIRVRGTGAGCRPAKVDIAIYGTADPARPFGETRRLTKPSGSFEIRVPAWLGTPEVADARVIAELGAFSSETSSVLVAP